MNFENYVENKQLMVPSEILNEFMNPKYDDLPLEMNFDDPEDQTCHTYNR
jgi:hypothetical protein